MSICARQERFCFRKDKSHKHQKIRPLPYTIETCTIRYTEDDEDDDDDDGGGDGDGGYVVMVMMTMMVVLVTTTVMMI